MGFVQGPFLFISAACGALGKGSCLSPAALDLLVLPAGDYQGHEILNVLRQHETVLPVVRA